MFWFSSRKYFRTSREKNLEIIESRDMRLNLINKVSIMHDKLVESIEATSSCYTFQMIIALSAYVLFTIMSLFALFNGVISTNPVAIRNAAFMMIWNIFYTFTVTFLIYTCSATTGLVRMRENLVIFSFSTVLFIAGE